MSVTTLTPDGKARELERIAQGEGQLAADKAEVVAAFPRDRTDAGDRPAGAAAPRRRSVRDDSQRRHPHHPTARHGATSGTSRTAAADDPLPFEQ